MSAKNTPPIQLPKDLITIKEDLRALRNITADAATATAAVPVSTSSFFEMG
jgi:hypothetical protein